LLEDQVPLTDTDRPLRIQERAEALIRELEHEPRSEPALGWSCSYTPQELILAAGLTPVRIPTSLAPAQEWSQGYLPANLCPYVHRLLRVGLSGEGPRLRGTVFVASCDPMRRLADIWHHYAEPGFFHRLDVPRRDDAPARGFLLSVLEDFRRALEGFVGERIRARDLNRAAAELNRTRRIMRELARMRAMPLPALTGTQFQRIALLAEGMSRDRFNRMAAEFLSRARRDLLRESRALSRTRRPRLLLAGCLAEDAGLPSLLEEAGARVAADDLCSGMRHFRTEVAENAARPLEAIAAGYLHRGKCPRMAGRGERIRNLVSLARESWCDGVVFHTLAFCDLHQMDLPALQEELRAANIPCLPLEREHLSGLDSGQLRTRVQAFVELLG
jgi:benzoyl-CoA reductase/2-hydroxyglutaryl-CoA dehydratase subunit BcrC/BadD/HgdB